MKDEGLMYYEEGKMMQYKVNGRVDEAERELNETR